MVSKAVTGPVGLPAVVELQMPVAVATGLCAASKHAMTGCFCVRTQVELSVAPDSLVRTGIEQTEKLSADHEKIVLMAETESWEMLQWLRNSLLSVS